MSYRDQDLKDIRTLRRSYTLEKAPRPRPSLHIETETLGHIRSKSTEKWGTPSHTRIRDSTAYSPLGLVAKSRPELETTIPSMRGLLQRDLSSAKLKRRMELPVEDFSENKTPKSRAEIHEEIRNKIKSMSLLTVKKDKEEEIEFDVEELKGPLIDTQGTLGDEINQEEDKINRKKEWIHYENHGEDQESKEISIIEYLKCEHKSRKTTHEEDMHKFFEEKPKQENRKLSWNEEAFSKEGEKPIQESKAEVREKEHKEFEQKHQEQEIENYQDQNETQSKEQNSLHIKSKDIKALAEGETVQFTFREEKEGHELNNEPRQDVKPEKSGTAEAIPTPGDQETAKIDSLESKSVNQKESIGNIGDEDSKAESQQELEPNSESENSIEQSMSESDSEDIAQFQENESLARAENEIELGGNRLFNTENSEEESKRQAENDKQGVGKMEKEIKEGEQEIESPTTKKIKKGGKKKKKTKKKDEGGEKEEKSSKPKKSSTKKKERSKSQEKDAKKLVKKVSLVKISPSKAGDSDKTKRKSSPKRISIKLQPAGRKSLTNRSESETDSPKKRKSLLNHSRDKSVDRSRSSSSSSPSKIVKVKSLLKKAKTILTDAQEIPKKEQEIKILENFESPKNAQSIIEHQKKKELKKSKAKEATVSVDLTQYTSNNQEEQAKPNKKSETKPEALTLNLTDKQTSSKSKEAMSPTKGGRAKEISISVAEDKASKLIKSPSQKKMTPANQEAEKNPIEKELNKQTGNAIVKEKSPTKINKVQAIKH